MAAIHDSTERDERDAFRIVDERLDAGVSFEARCRKSITFWRAVEEARTLRAYAPGALRARVVEARR